MRATAKGEDDEWDEQDDEALVGEEQQPSKKKGFPPEKKGFSPGPSDMFTFDTFLGCPTMLDD